MVRSPYLSNLILACMCFAVVCPSGVAQPVDECSSLASAPADSSSAPQRTGSFEYVVNGARWSEEKIVGKDGNPISLAVLFVDVTARNASDKPLVVPWAEVKDQSGKTHSAVLKDYLRPCTFSADPISPGESKRAYFVFDVPNDGQYSVVVFGGQDAKERGTDPLELPVPSSK